jgi:hypothetical protein
VSEGTNGDVSNNTTWWKSNQGAGLLSAGFFTMIALYLFLFTDYDRELRDGFLLGFFPIMSACMCVFISLVMCFDSFRKQTESNLAALDLKFFFFVIGVIAWSGLFFWFLVKVGFVITAPFYMLGLTYAMGLRPLKTAFLTSLGICVAVFTVFAVINAPMPLGPEWVMESLGLPLDWGT